MQKANTGVVNAPPPAQNPQAKMIYTSTDAERRTYGLYGFGQCCAYVLVTGFLQLFLTDIGVPAAAIGVIFLLARVWDAINDPLFGMIVDKSRLKGGKYLPWMKLSTILMPVFTIAIFLVPGSLPVTTKIVLAGVLYVLWGTVYTICDVPIFALCTAMTKNVPERNALLSYGRIGAYVGLMLIGIVVPFLYPSIGWLATAIVMAVFTFAGMLPITRTAKERYVEHSKPQKTGGLLKGLFQNRFLMIFVVANILLSLFNISSISSYFYIHAMGGPQTIGIISAILLVPSSISILLMPVIIKRVDKYYVLIFTAIAGSLLSVLTWVLGYESFLVYMVINVIKSLLTSIGGMLSVLFIADCTEYSLFKTGQHNEGLSFSLQTFTTKITGAISGSLGMFALAAIGFVEGAGAVQSQATIDSMWALITLVPAVGQALFLFIMLFGYKLRDKDVQLMARVNQGELSREEAKSQFSKKLKEVVK